MDSDDFLRMIGYKMAEDRAKEAEARAEREQLIDKLRLAAHTGTKVELNGREADACLKALLAPRGGK